MKTACIIVDAQWDFITGSLGASGRSDALPAILAFARSCDYVVASRDWHPRNHCSFKQHGGPWPSHCVQGTRDAQIVGGVESMADVIVSKGTDPEVDQYSAFEGYVERLGRFKGYNLFNLLADEYVDRVVVVGYCLDYCVMETAVEAQRLGIETWVPLVATRGVKSSTSEIATQQMRLAGVRVLSAVPA